MCEKLLIPKKEEVPQEIQHRIVFGVWLGGVGHARETEVLTLGLQDHPQSGATRK